MNPVKVGMVTKEWPPNVYGGAGVHVVQLAEALRGRSEVALSVHCFGEAREDAQGAQFPIEFSQSNPALQAIATDVAIANALSNVDLVHTHTWYANMAGHLASLLYGIPHILTAHSLEPLRPWKAEQLAGGYQLSSWIEKSSVEAAAAIIAVSDGMRADLLAAYPNVDPLKVHTIRNGVDTTKFSPNLDHHILAKYEITNCHAYEEIGNSPEEANESKERPTPARHQTPLRKLKLLLEGNFPIKINGSCGDCVPAE